MSNKNILTILAISSALGPFGVYRAIHPRRSGGCVK